MRRHGVRALGPVLALLLAGAAPARAAGEAAGTTAGSFLVVGSGASVLSMAGATLATGNDLAAAAWNPASLAAVDALQFQMSHAPLPGGATQDWAAAGGRLRGGETRWATHALFHREGGIEGRDAFNNPTGSLAVSDLALGARLAHPLGRSLSAGFGAQWVLESLAGTNGSGFAFDAGLRARAGDLGFALAARNLGSGIDYSGTRYDLPGVVAAGMSWSDAERGLRLAADLESPSHYYRDLRVGGEWTWHERVALRAGYRLQMGAPADEQLSGASFGLGTGVGGMWMDYAYSPEGGQATGQHRIGLTFRPGVPAPGGAPMRAQQSPPVERAPRRNVAVWAVPEAKPRLSGSAKSGSGAPAAAAPAPGKPAPAASAPAPASAAPTPAGAPAGPAGETSAARVAPEPVVRPTYVVVAQGETLAAIARRWDTSVSAIMMTNDLVREQVAPGTRLKLPPPPKR